MFGDAPMVFVPGGGAGGAPTGPAGGDLAGTYPNPTAPNKAIKLTPTAVKTTAYTAVSGDLVRTDTTAGAFVVTLPAAAVGAVVAVKKMDATANLVTIAAAGADTIDTLASVTLKLLNEVRTFVGTTAGWVVESGLNTLTALDARYVLVGATAGGDLAGTYPSPTLAGAFRVVSAGDGTTLVTTAFQTQVDAAAAVGGGAVTFGPGTHIVSGLVMKTGVHLCGPGHKAAVLKLPNSANGPVITSINFATNTGTDTGTGPFSISLEGFSVDGNKANNTSGVGIQIYARDFIMRDLRVYSCAGDGVFTEWANTVPAGVNDAIECDIDNVKSHDNGGWGFNIQGPHDGFMLNCISYLNTSGGFTFTRNSHGFLARQCHTWGTTHPFGVVLGQESIKWDLCETEATGGATGVLILFKDCTVTGGAVYDPLGSGATIGIQIGDATHTPGSVRTDTTIRGCAGGALVFVGSGGYGHHRLSAYQAAGTMVVGTPTATDVIDIPTPNGTSVGTLGLNGSLTRDVVGINYLRHRSMLPDPGASTGWYKLGTWTTASGIGGSRLLVEVTGTSGYNANAATVGRTIIVAATGNGTQSPNVVGYFFSEGGTAAITSVKAVANAGVATGLVWDIWAQVGTFTGNCHVRVDTGTDAHAASWTWLGSSGADPGTASSTVSVLVSGVTSSQLVLAGSQITSGTVPYARLPVGTTTSTVAAGDDSRLLGYANVQVFTASGTWTKPAGVTTTSVFLISSGGGGGSGPRRASGTATSGGGGGGGGAVSFATFRSVDLGSTETIVIGAVGTGGLAVTANDTSGNNGVTGGVSTFGTTIRVRAGGGVGGGAGGTGAAAGGSASNGMVSSGAGGAGGLGAAGVAGSAASAGAGGGGAGGISVTPAAFAGAAGGNATQLANLGTGAAGAIDGAGGNATGTATNTPIGGPGGGGGGSSITTVGGAGGNGGNYGGGGGGGGSSLNGFNSGAGGNGVGGIVIVTSQ